MCDVFCRQTPIRRVFSRQEVENVVTALELVGSRKRGCCGWIAISFLPAQVASDGTPPQTSQTVLGTNLGFVVVLIPEVLQAQTNYVEFLPMVHVLTWPRSQQAAFFSSLSDFLCYTLVLIPEFSL